MAANFLVENTLSEFSNATKKLEEFLSPQEKLAVKFKKCAKQLYDWNILCENTEKKNVLSELIVDDFDEEQIWQELELNNEPDVSNLLASVSQLVAGKNSIHFNIQNDENTQNEPEDADDSENEDIDNPHESEESEESEIDKEITNYKSQLNGAENSDSEDEIDFDFDNVDMGSEEGETDEDILKQGEKDKKDKSLAPISKSKSSKKSSVVDDNFFKLSQLEEFLIEQENRDERKRKKDMGDGGLDEDEDDDIDMFQDIEDEEGEDARNAMYDEFFDDAEGESMVDKKQVRFKDDQKEELNDDGDDDDDDVDDDGIEEEEDDDDDDDDNDQEEEDEIEEEGSEANDNDDEKDFEELMKTKGKVDLLKAGDSDGEDVRDILGGGAKKEDVKSSYEIRQDKLKKQINKLEISNLASKGWQMSGEVGATLRPENSLLEEHLQFDHTTKMTPVITEETSQKVEDIIIQRIKDKAWDDVERKVKPTEDTMEYKKRIVLDQEKSKQSLAQIYEEEYIKQQKKDKEEVEEDKDPVRENIKNMMQSLFIKLDALSNFHYTPKQIQPELRVISNLPSITIEEVAPVSKSDAQLIAPEEIKAKSKGELKGTTEKSETDRKRERRKKKAEKRTKHKEKLKREKLVNKMNPGLGNKYSKEGALRDLEKSSKITKNDVTVVKSDKKKSSLTSSTSFFKQLQEEVKTQVLSRKAEKMKRKNQAIDKNSAKKLKL